VLHARFSIGVLQVDDRDTSGSCQLEGVSTNTRLVRNIRRIFTSILSPNDKNAHGLLEILPKDHPGVLGIDGFDGVHILRPYLWLICKRARKEGSSSSIAPGTTFENTRAPCDPPVISRLILPSGSGAT
jgi:hypothetical protein